jgi:hypothetical protein
VWRSLITTKRAGAGSEEILQIPPVCGEALIKTKRAGAGSEELL